MPEPSSAAADASLCQEYTVLRRLATGGSITGRALPLAAAALVELGLQEVERVDADQDSVLLAASRVEDHRGALLCLRCRVSWPLELRVRALHRQFAKNYGVELLELGAFALDDTGRPLPFQRDEQETTTAEPFTLEVIRSFTPELSSLGHWARLKLDGRNDLKAYLKEQGVLLIGPWALLADASQKQVREAAERLSRTLVAEVAEALHRRYVPLYRREKLLYRQRTGRQRGWVPDGTFLMELQPDLPPQETQDQLEQLADALRLLKTGQWQRAESDLLDGQAAVAGEPADMPLPEADGEDEQGLGEQQLMALLEEEGRAYVAEMLAALPAGHESLAYWRVWTEGLTTRAIAERCNSNPARVSRRLNVQARASEIATRLLVCLQRLPAVQQDARLAVSLDSIDGQEQAVVRVMNHLLNPEQEEGVPPLRRWVQDALLSRAGAPNDRSGSNEGGEQ
jgi:hypothetical protein